MNYLLKVHSLGANWKQGPVLGCYCGSYGLIGELVWWKRWKVQRQQLNALGLFFRRGHYSLPKYVLSACFMLSIVLGTGKISLMSTLKISALWELNMSNFYVPGCKLNSTSLLALIDELKKRSRRWKLNLGSLLLCLWGSGEQSFAEGTWVGLNPHI